MAPKGPDEGAMIEFLRLTMGALLRRQGRVSPCGARYFPSDGKVTKGSPGDVADGHFVPIGPLTPGPPLRGYPLGQAEFFRRAKSEWRSAVPPGPLGPGFAKIASGAAPHLRLALTSQQYQFG